jgi:uncharacterized protein YkwD
MGASKRARGWAQFAVVGGTVVALVATVAPSAGAAAKAHRRLRHHHHHHHRHRPNSAVQASAGSGCAYADAAATSASLSEMRAAVVCLINERRNSDGLPSLRASAELDRSAQNWNRWMVATGNFTHGSNFAGRISAVGYDWQTAGENIATGFATPRQVVAAWMASPDHCRNILDPSFRDIGTGITAAAVGSWASQPSTWTNDFGLTMSQSAPSGNTGPQNGCPYQ